MVREMAPNEKEVAFLRAHSQSATLVEERSASTSSAVTAIQRTIRASLESSNGSLGGDQGQPSRRASSLSGASLRSGRQSEVGLEEHVERYSIGEALVKKSQGG
jgi:hypothetical protein